MPNSRQNAAFDSMHTNISNGAPPASSHELLPYAHPSPCAAAAPQDLAQEELAPHDSFLEYIDSMLMDESFEDSSWQVFVPSGSSMDDFRPSILSLNDRYQHIFRGFNDILDENTSGPSAFEVIERSNGASDKESPSEISLSDFSVTSILQWPGDDDGMDVAEYQMPLTRMEEVGLGVRQSKTPHDGQLYQHHMEDVRGGSDGIFDGTTAENETKGGLDVGFGGQLQEGDTIQHVRPEHDRRLFNANKQGTQPSYGMVSGGAVPAVQPLGSHTNDTQSIRLNGSVHVAGGHDVSLVRNADLPAELYAQLFDEWPLTHKESALPLAKTASSRLREGRCDEALANPVDLKTLLLSSAKAVGEGNVKRAMEILQQIQQEGTSPHGSGLQRVVHYFTEAMMARLSGMGNTLYNAMANTAQLPSPLMMIKAYKMVFDACPYVKISYHFANQYILKAAQGATRLHIIDYGILYGFQWPCLIYALAHRPEGPPFIRITGFEYPANTTDINPTATTEGTSCRLREYAKTYNVPFEYHAISASKWEDIDASSLRISSDEVLVLNSFNRLGHIHDENIAHPSRRDRLLKQMRRLNPHLFVLGSMNAGHSSPFFAPRVREAFYYYSNMFDVLHTAMMDDSPERLMFERELMGRSILNVVACEGVERVELPETYKQWQTRIKRAGFRQLTIIPSVWEKARRVMMNYHKDFNLLHDSDRWVLLGWRGRSMQALSAWERA